MKHSCTSDVDGALAKAAETPQLGAELLPVVFPALDCQFRFPKFQSIAFLMEQQPRLCNEISLVGVLSQIPRKGV